MTDFRYRTTKPHLTDLVRSIQAAIKTNLFAGRFKEADEMRSELAWLVMQIGAGMYRGARE